MSTVASGTVAEAGRVDAHGGVGGGRHDVVIVGAGFTGTALAINLARLLPRRSRVALVAGRDRAGLGIAYGTADPDHRLNVQAGRMSLFPDDPGDFVRWLEANGHAAEVGRHAATLPEAYAPRAVYGRYLRDRLAEALAAADGRVTVREVPLTAVAAERGPGGWTVRLDDGSSVTGSRLALCLGNVGGGLPIPRDRINPAVLDRVIGDPWSPEADAIAPEETVLMVGTGLTMVDRALTRRRLGHTGRTVAVSRRGLLPMPHVAPLPQPETVPGLLDASGVVDVTRRVRATITAGTEAGGDWRAVVDGLRPITQQLWDALPPRDRVRFLRHLNVYWNVARHRMAPEIAAEVGAMRAEGSLEVVAARLESLEAAPGGRVLARLRERGTGVVREVTVDRVLNCTGLERSPSASGNPLLASLLAEGAVRPEPTGLGIDVAADGSVVGANGVAADDLLALGPLTVGRFWEMVAVPDLRVQCARAAETIAERVAADGARVPA